MKKCLDNLVLLVYNTPVMEITNIADFITRAYKKGYTMRVIDRGEVSGEVTLFADRISFTDEYGNDVILYTSDEYEGCKIEHTPYGNVEITSKGGHNEYFELSKKVDKEDFETIMKGE